MKTSDLVNTPIRTIWGSHDSQWLLWERELPIVSDLEELIPGRQYDILSDAPYTLGKQTLQVGWNQIEFEGITFIPGKILNPSWWDYAQDKLTKVNLWKLLPLLGVKEVKIVKELPPPATGLGQFTIWPSTGTILVLDTLMWPPLLFPVGLWHEAIHLWQVYTGLFDGFKKKELMAYMGSQICHWLLNDDMEVFNSPSYPFAMELGKMNWD